MSENTEVRHPVFQVNYLKSNDYREVHCDGLVGNPITPERLWISFYSERFPIPRVVGFQSDVKDNQVTIDETQSPVFMDSRQGLVRNVEFGIYLDLGVAEKMHDWLGKQIEQMRNMRK